jgi:hypothetical protein
MTPRGAVIILISAAVLGMVGTLAIGHDPGFLLGFLIIVGSVVAALAVRRPAAHLVIPLPALTYLVASVLTGAIHDHASDTSKAQLGINFLQWIASGFIAMSAATILVIVVVAARWVLSRQLVAGQFPMSQQRPAPGRAPRSRPAPGARPGPWDDRQGGNRGAPPGPAPRGNRNQRDSRGPWNDRNPRDRRDPWGRRD